MAFKNEVEFEKAVIEELFEHGWEKEVLRYKTEDDLIQNWADILFENNRQIDKLGDYPLTKTEMKQILDQVRDKKTPLNLNGFINGKTILVKRDNPDDKDHFGKYVSLKIYDRDEIAAGQSRYQIAQQPKFRKTNPLATANRGDFMLLINGMPVIHVELKNDGHHVAEAYNQIERYRKEGIFTGIFGLVQIFVAMEPNEMVYFANPGPDVDLNPKLLFHWTDSQNEIYTSWKDIVSKFLYIPMAHELIGFYTVADTSDGVLKVMRPYQVYAASQVSSVVSRTRWSDRNIYGGYIWHTTGSGKTLTSFKSAQLIANSNCADKVIFLVDRIVLGNQTYLAYKGFADDSETIQDTSNTVALLGKLKSTDPANTLIVTSIQKMSNIRLDEGINKKDIDVINQKRIVFIVDECHRSTFGDMLANIKKTFPGAIFFGFSGTPIMDANKKKMSTTADIFGNELARYVISDGIRDGNVLEFDPIPISTFDEKDTREKIAQAITHTSSFAEALKDPKKKKAYLDVLNIIPMAANDRYKRGIEDYLPESQYETEEHRLKVVEDILDNWYRYSVGFKFSAIFATSSIKEACLYYKLFKKVLSSSENYHALNNLKITCLFDPNYDNNPDDYKKEQSMIEILKDYNSTYDKKFTIPTWAKFKEDVSLRLARKETYRHLSKDDDSKISELHKETLDLLIVVDQMLTGFDTKWLNVLYLDKTLEEENIIQAFSRTNRPFGLDKPHGTIKYYRRPYTMKRDIEIAFNHYSGDKAYAVFVSKLEGNLKMINAKFDAIKEIFESSGIKDFIKLPADDNARMKFAKEFKELKLYYEAAKIQGFVWSKLEYGKVKMHLDENIFNILILRYKELYTPDPGDNPKAIPFDIKTTLTQMETQKIDSDYLNSKFKKYIKTLQEKGDDKALVKSVLKELHQSFASLTQDEQKIAKVILNDIDEGELNIESGKTLRDYINLYESRIKDDQIHRFAKCFNLNENELRKIMNLHVDESNINAYGRFDKLINSVKDLEPVKKYYKTKYGEILKDRMLYMKLYEITKNFILRGGFKI